MRTLCLPKLIRKKVSVGDGIHIRVHRILDPDPDLLVKDTDPDPYPSIIKEKLVRKTLIPALL
jgi:hypothetical protein